MSEDYQVSSPLWLAIIYSILLIVGNTAGLCGNSLVIFSTLNKQLTFKLDGGTVTFLRNLALADVIFILLYPLPMTLTYCTGWWVYGDWFCTVTGHLISVPVFANMNFILLISLHRFTRCKYPLKVHQLTPNIANMMSGITWAFSCLFIVYTVLQLPGSEFNNVLATCSFLFPRSVLNGVLIVLLIGLPFFIIVLINFLLWLHVRSFSDKISQHRKPSLEPNFSQKRNISKTLESSGSIVLAGAQPSSTETKKTTELPEPRSKKESKGSLFSTYRAIITTTAVTALFAFTWMPTVIRFMVAGFAGEQCIPFWLEQLRYLYFLGPWGNPLLYVTINRGFRDYFKSFFRKLCVSLCRDRS